MFQTPTTDGERAPPFEAMKDSSEPSALIKLEETMDRLWKVLSDMDNKQSDSIPSNTEIMPRESPLSPVADDRVEGDCPPSAVRSSSVHWADQAWPTTSLAAQQSQSEPTRPVRADASRYAHSPSPLTRSEPVRTPHLHEFTQEGRPTPRRAMPPQPTQAELNHVEPNSPDGRASTGRRVRFNNLVSSIRISPPQPLRQVSRLRDVRPRTDTHRDAPRLRPRRSEVKVEAYRAGTYDKVTPRVDTGKQGARSVSPGHPLVREVRFLESRRHVPSIHAPRRPPSASAAALGGEEVVNTAGTTEMFSTPLVPHLTEEQLHDLLHELFVYYCSYGDHLNTGHMTNSKLTKLLRDCRVIDAGFHSADVDIIFRKIVSGNSRKRSNALDFTQFQLALLEVSHRRYPEAVPYYTDPNGDDPAYDRLLDEVVIPLAWAVVGGYVSSAGPTSASAGGGKTRAAWTCAGHPAVANLLQQHPTSLSKLFFCGSSVDAGPHRSSSPWRSEAGDNDVSAATSANHGGEPGAGLAIRLKGFVKVTGMVGLMTDHTKARCSDLFEIACGSVDGLASYDLFIRMLAALAILQDTHTSKSREPEQTGAETMLGTMTPTLTALLKVRKVLEKAESVAAELKRAQGMAGALAAAVSVGSSAPTPANSSSSVGPNSFGMHSGGGGRGISLGASRRAHSRSATSLSAPSRPSTSSHAPSRASSAVRHSHPHPHAHAASVRPGGSSAVASQDLPKLPFEAQGVIEAMFYHYCDPVFSSASMPPPSRRRVTRMSIGRFVAFARECGIIGIGGTCAGCGGSPTKGGLLARTSEEVSGALPDVPSLSAACTGVVSKTEAEIAFKKIIARAGVNDLDFPLFVELLGDLALRMHGGVHGSASPARAMRGLIYGKLNAHITQEIAEAASASQARAIAEGATLSPQTEDVRPGGAAITRVADSKVESLLQAMQEPLRKTFDSYTTVMGRPTGKMRLPSFTTFAVEWNLVPPLSEDDVVRVFGAHAAVPRATGTPSHGTRVSRQVSAARPSQPAPLRAKHREDHNHSDAAYLSFRGFCSALVSVACDSFGGPLEPLADKVSRMFLRMDREDGCSVEDEPLDDDESDGDIIGTGLPHPPSGPSHYTPQDVEREQERERAAMEEEDLRLANVVMDESLLRVAQMSTTTQRGKPSSSCSRTVPNAWASNDSFASATPCGNTSLGNTSLASRYGSKMQVDRSVDVTLQGPIPLDTSHALSLSNLGHDDSLLLTDDTDDDIVFGQRLRASWERNNKGIVGPRGASVDTPHIDRSFNMSTSTIADATGSLAIFHPHNGTAGVLEDSFF